MMASTKQLMFGRMPRLGLVFPLLALAALSGTLVVGYAAGLGIGLLRWEALAPHLDLTALAAGVMILTALFHFHRMLSPLDDPAKAGAASTARPVDHFSRDYWSGLAAFTMLLPQAGYWAGDLALAETLHLTLLMVCAGVLAGLPPYFLALDLLGEFVARRGLARVHVSLRTRLLLLGGVIPLLSGVMLCEYLWWRAGVAAGEMLLVWMLLGLSSLSVTYLAIRGIVRSLDPVRDLIRSRGELDLMDAALLRPRSTDEIGYLTQTLGKVLRRLEYQNAHVRAIFDTAVEGIVVVNEAGLVRTFNPAAEQLFGRRARAVRGRPLRDLLPNVDGPGGLPSLVNTDCEAEGRHAEGHALHLRLRVSEMRINGRRMYSCLIADLSGQRLMESRLYQAETRFRDLVETAHDLVWTMDTRGRWTYVNEASAAIYGLEPKTMLGRHAGDFAAPECAERDARAFAELIAGKDLVHYETVHQDRAGEPRHLSFNGRAQLDERGAVMWVSGTARDITEQKAYQQQLYYQAQHDALTGLYNRNFFQQELERVISRVARSGAECALFYIDLDQFKLVNDTVGHGEGDRLLVECAAILTAHVREGDLVSRFGGDEFTILLYNVERECVAQIAEKLRQSFEQYRFLSQGRTFSVTSSIGVAMIDNETQGIDEAMAHADLACNLAKTQGRNRVVFHDRGHSAVAAEDVGWAQRVREAVEHDRLRLAYQPIVDLRGGTAREYEVLVRMTQPGGGEIMPGGFIPAAERFGLIQQVDRWVVCRAIERLARENTEGRRVGFSLNLSGKAFDDAGLPALIEERLARHGLDPALLTFEISETAASARLAPAVEFIERLRSLGCKFALDDFGSGSCSFTHLRHLPVDRIKIDGAVIKGLAQNPYDQAMVRSLTQVARALGKHTVAEQVEDAGALEMLREMGVDFAQGHHLGAPGSDPVLH